MDEELKIEVGKVYSAKRSRRVFLGLSEFYADRQVLWVSDTEVQYDGPVVKPGARYPKISLDKFRNWAKEDITAFAER
jgi:hypothetical protein